MAKKKPASSIPKQILLLVVRHQTRTRAIVSFTFDMETMRLSKRRLIKVFICEMLIANQNTVGEDQMRILRNAVPK